jgi:ketol-acid reductoisomerase
MKEILKEIQTGQFAREFIEENQTGRVTMRMLRMRAAESQLEEVGAELRSMMPFVQQARQKAEEKA